MKRSDWRVRELDALLNEFRMDCQQQLNLVRDGKIGQPNYTHARERAKDRIFIVMRQERAPEAERGRA